LLFKVSASAVVVVVLARVAPAIVFAATRVDRTFVAPVVVAVRAATVLEALRETIR